MLEDWASLFWRNMHFEEQLLSFLEERNRVQWSLKPTKTNWKEYTGNRRLTNKKKKKKKKPPPKQWKRLGETDNEKAIGNRKNRKTTMRKSDRENKTTILTTARFAQGRVCGDLTVSWGAPARQRSGRGEEVDRDSPFF